MAKKIAVTMYKGGSGKTTTSINLAAALHTKGKRVLLVDLDPQANATSGVGVNPLEAKYNSSHFFTTEDIGVREVVVKTPFGMDIVPSHINLAKAENSMSAAEVLTLKGILEAVDSEYDFIIIDTAPGEGLLTISALAVADEAFIPLQVHFWSMDGLANTMNQVEKVRGGLNPSIRVGGILPVMVQPRTTLAQEVLTAVREAYPRLTLDNQIDFSIRHPTLAASGQPMVLAEPTHAGAIAYQQVAERYL